VYVKAVDGPASMAELVNGPPHCLFGLTMRRVAVKHHALRHRASGRALCVLALMLQCVLMLSCAPNMPALLHVERLVPGAVEEGDSLLFSGDGFVANAPARLRFRGTLYRVGGPPRAIEFVTEGKGLANDRVELQLTPELGDRLLGAPKRHVTFRGSVEIAFRAARPGAPPVAGRLEGAVLDVYPGVESQAEVDVTGLSEFLGVEFERAQDAAGLVVLGLHSHGRAAQAGVQLADRVVVHGGVNVHTLSDLAPYPGQRTAAFGVKRAGTDDVVALTVDVTGYAPRSAEHWLWGLALAGAAGILLLALRGPLGAAFAALDAGVHLRGTSRVTSRARVARRGLPRGLPVFLAVSALFLLIGTRAHLPAAEIDVVWVSLCALALLALAGLTEGGIDREGNWSASRAVSGLLRLLPVQAALGLVVMAVGVDRTSFSLSEISTLQGAYPFEYYAFTSPVGFVGAGCFMGALLLSHPTLQVPRAGQSHAGSMVFIGHVFFECFWLLLLALFVALFAGGWQSPFGLLGASPNLSAILAFQVKYALLFVIGTEVRERMPLIPKAVCQRIVWRWLLPVAACVPLLVPIWAAGVWPAWLKTSCNALFTLLTVSLLVAALTRSRWLGARVSNHSSMNPWL
jgi:NADH:ubiquinone oxidoreductase subunit H